MTVPHSFCTNSACSDGFAPNGVILGSDGNFYGTTRNSPVGGGTAFKVTPQGAVTTLHTFCETQSCPDGGAVLAPLLQGTNGKFYGTASSGGTDFDGTVFSLDVGLGGFLNVRPGSGKVGSKVQILGSGLTGATAVRFDGTAASFTVDSDSEITATVPAEAATGNITVTTPSGPLSSSVPFKVVPQVLSFSPSSGAVGTVVTINGQSFAGTEAVSFHGTLATVFTVKSDTEIQATVSKGATTGWIAVATAGGRAQSTGTFTVTP